MKILTVGDGDFSFSTALTRAYPSVDVTATTLLESKEQLLKTYPHAVLDELEKNAAAISYGIDATQLHSRFDESSFDIVVFNHPHLGDYYENDESVHRQRHYCLLAHYLASASVLSPRVHVALCGGQHLSWQLEEATEKAGLKQAMALTVSKPFHQLFPPEFDVSLVQTPSFSKRMLRKKTGSNHWLVKYGYTHQRTFLIGPPVDLSGSKHYLFERSSTWQVPFVRPSTDMKITLCNICGYDAVSIDALRDHCLVPSLLDTLPSDRIRENNRPGPIVNTSKANNTLHCEEKVQGNLLNRGSESSTTLDVAAEYEGKRMRWYLQHIMNYSKRQAQDCISAGNIQVNGHVATDSSRILRKDDKIKVEEEERACLSNSVVEIVERLDDQTLVALKPVGMRCNDTTESLVTLVSLQERRSYTSITKLDTGCSGLCLLVALPLPSPLPEVQHTFTALVHGKTTVSGAIEIPVGDLRRWKQCQSKDTVMATIQCLEQTEDLSTLSITLGHAVPSVTSVICYYFRKIVGCPVVGDRFASQEYLTLPRFVRNRLKHRLCFMCTAIQSDEKYTAITVPAKFQASHWNNRMAIPKCERCLKD